MLPITVGTVCDRVRAILNDQAGAVFTDTVILPHFQIAYDDLRNELQDNNIPITNKTTAGITILTGVTDIGGATGPALPIDMVDILAIWERQSGSTNNFILMDRNQFLPKISPVTAYLQYWSWSDQIVHFLGATGDIEVKIDYVAQTLPDGINENTQIKLYNARNFLGFRTAGLAARFIGENPSRADDCDKNADRTLETLLSISIKSEQKITTRRQPFMGRYRRGGYNWW